MRRIALLSVACLTLLVAGGCRNDGRTLRDPEPFQTSSISTLAASIDTIEPLETLPTLPGEIDEFDLVVTAPWADGDLIDTRYTCDGLNLSPALAWDPAPAGTVEIVVTLSDLDAPDFAHWGLAGVSPELTLLAEDTIPLGAYETMNGVGAIGYTGPCPPAGTAHTYVFTVHFLDRPTTLADGDPTAELFDELLDREIAATSVNGSFSRG